MDLLWWKRRRVILRRSKSSFSLCLFALMFCLLLLLCLRLPEAPLDLSSRGKRGIEEEAGIGRLGEMMVKMLPDDLAFTIFVPSEDALEQLMMLRAGDSLTEQELNNNTYAIVSRVMGFSAMPRQLPSQAVPMREEVCLDSISGFRLSIWKDPNQKLVVNGVESETVDLRKGEIVIHKMAGVIMDANFRRSFSPD